jgi:hypothetical protein
MGRWCALLLPETAVRKKRPSHFVPSTANVPQVLYVYPHTQHLHIVALPSHPTHPIHSLLRLLLIRLIQLPRLLRRLRLNLLRKVTLHNPKHTHITAPHPPTILLRLL